jgi:hypothetical protein
MVATPKTLRQRPQQDINKYNLYYVVDQNIGLTNIHNRQMTICSGTTSQPGFILDNDAPGANLSVIDIGFTFQFNNKNYKQVHISPYGWLTLDFPGESWNHGEFFNSTSAAFYNGCNNIDIRNDMTTNHVLLCPWFEFLRNYCNRKNDDDPDGSGTYVHATNAQMSNLDSEYTKFGMINQITNTFIPRYSPELVGVRYKRENSYLGRRLIVRWNSLTKTNGIEFECVLYENGRIEYRYCPLNKLQINTDTYYHTPACIGIFGSKTENIFRDFASELVPNKVGYLSGSYTWNDDGFGNKTTINSGTFYTQQKYERGGSIYDENFRDIIISSFTNIGASGERPNISSLNCQQNWPGRLLNGAMFIFQPHTLKRKILPRKQINVINTNRIAQTNSLFDDRQTLQNTTTTVSFPSKLQRNFAGNTLRTQLFHDIFENDIVTTGSSINSYDVFQNTQELENFTQQNVPYNENSQNFIIDENLNFFLTGTKIDITPGFIQPLSSKEQIIIELPIQYTTTLLTTASSMYYYDNSIKSLTLCNGNISTLNENRAQQDVDRFARAEDYIGFNPCGILVTSGTYEGYLNSGSYDVNSCTQSNSYINKTLNEQTYKQAIQATYGNSVCVNQNFNATNTQTFKLPITQPFLIEKAIIEINIEADQDWCGDVTQYIQPLTIDNQIISGTQFVDVGGPAVTCALFHQYNNLNYKYRNLILSSTFTTITDNTSSHNLTYNVGDSRLQLSVYGFNAVGAQASAYVTPNSNWNIDDQVFTTFSGSVKMFTKPQTVAGCLATVRTIAYTSSSIINRTLLSATLANPFININHVATSPNTSGTTVNINSIANYGRSQTGFLDSGHSIFGKELLTNAKISKFQNNFLGAGQEYDYWINEYGAVEKFITTFPISLYKFTDSPYLIYPNQDLVFAIAKTRSVINTTTDDPYYTTFAHNIKLISGSNIKITLFGSYIKENKEYHNILKNTQDANVYDVIDNEPVLDQFEIFSRKSSFNSYTDLFMTGTLQTNAERTKAFNICNATNDIAFDQSQNYSYSLTKQYEVAGINLFAKLVSDKENYYDSYIPDIRQVVILNTGKTFGAWPIESLATWTLSDGTATDDWMLSFPFEPRYSQINRLKYMPTEFSIYDFNTSLPLPNKTRNIVVQQGNAVWNFDVDNNNLPTGLSSRDFAKSAFGFGDFNTYSIDGTGYKYFPQLRMGVDGSYYHPDIRGWKYGLINGQLTYTSCVFRKNHYGHLRDMLEQRPYTAFTNKSSGPVHVKFINPLTGKITNPENTWSSNVDFHCTSSMPYFDGESKNRPEINVNNMNLTLNSLSYSDNNITFQ